MSYVIRFEEARGLIISGDPGPQSIIKPIYLKSYNPDGHGGRGDIQWTDDPKEARQFATIGDAMMEYMRPSKLRPLRDDGGPNQPMKAFTIAVIPFHET